MNMNSCKCPTDSGKLLTEISSLSTLLKLVADESRLKIICILDKGEHCVCQILEHLGLSQSLVSHHLKDLKEGGMIQDRKEGLWVHYSLTSYGQRITKSILGLTDKEEK